MKRGKPLKNTYLLSMNTMNIIILTIMVKELFVRASYWFFKLGACAEFCVSPCTTYPAKE